MKGSFFEEMEKYHNDRRVELSDYILLERHGIIKIQYELGCRPDDTLIKYINELEYRGLKYEDVRTK